MLRTKKILLLFLFIFSALFFWQYFNDQNLFSYFNQKFNGSTKKSEYYQNLEDPKSLEVNFPQLSKSPTWSQLKNYKLLFQRQNCPIEIKFQFYDKGKQVSPDLFQQKISPEQNSILKQSLIFFSSSNYYKDSKDLKDLNSSKDCKSLKFFATDVFFDSDLKMLVIQWNLFDKNSLNKLDELTFQFIDPESRQK